MEIRPTHPGDVPALQAVLDATQLFPSEMLPDMIRDFFSNGGSAEIWLTCVMNDKAVGFCYAVPEELADGTWNMLAIAVSPGMQGGGCGSALTKHLETDLKQRGQRILIVDTSGTDAFERTRAFYAKSGYTQEARIRDFWAEGDDKIIFRKSLR